MRPPHFDDAFAERLRELFAWRRDVRHFDPAPLDEALVEELVGIAALSPSVGFSQPWRFVRVDDRGRRDRIIASFESANAQALAAYEGDDARRYASLKLAGLREAPVHLAVFCDTSTPAGKGLGRRTMPQMLEYSAVMAVYTLWLAARARGIGVGWVSILEPEAVTRALDVDAGWQLVAYLCLGYPLGEFETPELLRAGWERRDRRAVQILRR